MKNFFFSIRAVIEPIPISKTLLVVKKKFGSGDILPR
jgi:hypothetical protein